MFADPRIQLAAARSSGEVRVRFGLRRARNRAFHAELAPAEFFPINDARSPLSPVELTGHALVMLALFRRRIGPLSDYGIGQTFLKSLLAAFVMGAVVWSIGWGMDALLQAGSLLKVIAGATAGAAIYLGMCLWLQVREIDLLRRLRMGRNL